MNNYYVYFTLVNDSIGEEVQLDAKSVKEAREFIQGHESWFQLGEHTINMRQVVKFHVGQPKSKETVGFFR